MDMRRLVGRNFARIRRERKLTQEQVAESSGFSQQYISGLEQGHRNPSIVSLFELAQAIQSTPIELIQPPTNRDPTEKRSNPKSRRLRARNYRAAAADD
jgi:transcriptional regulator with XRE-family HTH domain